MAEIIEPPRTLKSKVGGSGAVSAEMLARADDAIAKLAVEYPDLAMQDVDALAALVEKAAADPKLRAQWLEQIFEASDEIRGLGAMFDYPLITSIADSLCSITEHLDTFDDKGVEIARAHLEAMHAVITNRVTGDKNEVGQQIAAAWKSRSTNMRRTRACWCRTQIRTVPHWRTSSQKFANACCYAVRNWFTTIGQALNMFWATTARYYGCLTTRSPTPVIRPIP